MKILRIIGSLNPHHGGPVEWLLRSSEAIMRVGHVVEVASLDIPDTAFLASMPFDVHALGEHNPLSRVRYSSKFVPWLKKHAREFDVAIIEGLWNYSSIGAWRALAGTCPYVVFSHGMMDPWFRRAYPLKHFLKRVYWLVGEGRVLRDAAYVAFTAEEERNLARGVFPRYQYRERVTTLGTADIDGDAASQIAAFHGLVPNLAGRRFLLFLSRIHPKKGCDILIRSFAHIAAEYTDLDLVLAGPDQVGWRSELHELAEALDIGSRVHWPGMLVGDPKWGAFKGAEAFVLPSHQENFGVVVAEALACRTPVLISDRVNIWREVQASGAGIIAPDTDEGTYDMIRGFLSLGALQRAEMSRAARQCFLEKFEIERASHDLLSMLTEVVEA
jgi:glycosyltransferase involved in cell wall biosynthesis